MTVKSPSYGIARVTLDGGSPVTVDLYSPSASWQQKVWSASGLTSGLHTVKIEGAGSKNPAATGTYLGLDAVDVAGALASSARTEETNTNTHLVWAGAWTSFLGSLYSGGSFKYANTTASVTITFSGVKLDLIGTKAYSYGKMKVTLDGSSTFTVDLYHAAPALYKQTLWSSGLLPLGDHTVTLEWTGDKNPASSNTFVSLDAVDVIGTVK